MLTDTHLRETLWWAKRITDNVSPKKPAQQMLAFFVP